MRGTMSDTSPPAYQLFQHSEGGFLLVVFGNVEPHASVYEQFEHRNLI
jgi:hypothetical protein